MIRSSCSAALLLAALATPALAQSGGNFTWSKALPAGSEVKISNVNGDIRVTPSTSGKVEVVGIKRGSSRDFDEIKAVVDEHGDGIEVCVVPSDSDDRCGGSRWHDHSDWNHAQIDFEVKVPSNVTVSAGAVSGDVTLSGVQGDVQANTVSGDLHLDHLRAASIRANTVSGDMDVTADALTGRGDLSFHSVSGDVTLNLPSNLDADLSMTTVSGDLNSDYQMTLANGRMNRRRIEAQIGKGGRHIDVTTVSGDLRLRKTD